MQKPQIFLSRIPQSIKVLTQTSLDRLEAIESVTYSVQQEKRTK